MNEFDVIIDLGSKNLKLGVFDPQLKMIYSSKQKILNSKEDSSLENSLKVLIRNAEKYLSSHIDDVVVLHDSSKFYSLDLLQVANIALNDQVQRSYLHQS